MKTIGKVTHYYGKINVAIIKLEGALSVGDKIKIQSGDKEFEQDVTSLEVEREAVESAKKGDEVGLKVDEKVKVGATVSRL